MTHTTRRCLGAELLENRVLLTADPSGWHNADLPNDVSGDKLVSPVDAVLVINDLNKNGPRDLAAGPAPAGMLDVNDDGLVTPVDAVLVLNELNKAEGEEGDLVRVRLEATEVGTDDPILFLDLNQDFELRAYVQDLTGRANGGVFAAYVDVNYPSNLVDITGAIQHGTAYGNSPSGSTNITGLIDEVGSADGLTPLGISERLLFRVPMRTKAFGLLELTADAPELFPAHQILVFGVPDGQPSPVVPLDLVEFVGTSVRIAEGQSPVARDDEYSGVEDQALIVDRNSSVLSNDTDVDLDPLTAVLVTQPSNGTIIEFNSDGSFSYQPNEDFNGVDSFQYAADDGEIPSDPATVTLVIEAVNDAPRVQDETYSTAVDAPLNVSAEEGVLANDFDVEGSPITAELMTDVSSGVLTLNEDGSFEYTPNVGFNGTDQFTYVVSDGELSSVEATATIEVGEITGNTAPLAVDDPDYVTGEGVTLPIDALAGVLANDTDADGDTLTAQLVSTTSNGQLALNDDGSFTYDPDPGFLGTDSFTYTAFDGELSSNEAMVTIAVQAVDNTPVAVDDTYETNEDTSLTIDAPGVLANDTDPNGDALTAVIDTSPASGAVLLNEDGSFSYTPFPNFNGVDSFTYHPSDGALSGNTATVSITVRSVNDAPVGIEDNYETVAATTLTVNAANGVLANDRLQNVDNDTLLAELVADVSNGVLNLNNNGSFSYTPDDMFVGTDTFTYVATDGSLSSEETTVTINVEAEEGLDVAITLVTTDLSGNPIDSIAVGGDFLLQAFVQDINPTRQEGVFAAYLDITYDASLAAVAGDIATSSQYPNGFSGDTSVAGLIDEVGAFDGFTPLGGELFLLFSVPFEATGGGELQFAADPAEESPSHDVLRFNVSDPVSPDRISYGVAAINIQGLTEPQALDDSYSVDTGMVLEVSESEGVLANDVGVDGGSLSAILVDEPENGTLTLNADGSFVYTPDTGFVGVDTFTYRAATVASSSEIATVTIDVGDLTPGSISGFVYFDVDNDGQRDAPELPIGDATVRLVGSGSFQTRETRTASDGSYSFNDVPAGTYSLEQISTQLAVDGRDTQSGVDSSTNDAFTVELGAGASAGDYNFGERGLHPAFIVNPLFFSSARRVSLIAAVDADNNQLWYSLGEGWEGFESVQVSLSNDHSTVTVTAPGFSATLRVAGNRDVMLMGNDDSGYLVRLFGSSSELMTSALTSAARAAAVDAVFVNGA